VSLQREIVLVLGQTGSGKTTWARRYVNTLNRAIVLDAGFNEYGAHECGTFHDLVNHISTRSFFRVSYSPLTFEMPLMFDLARVVGNCHLIIEEADRLDDPRAFLEYDEAITRGRHYGISMVGISLYPAKLPAMFRRQTTRLISFRQIEPRDIDYIAEIVGPIADDLPNLEKFSYIDWTPAGGAKIVKNSLTK
jgi:energy-coupling factor transporter ATP-binding protein EcfA2